MTAYTLREENAFKFKQSINLFKRNRGCNNKRKKKKSTLKINHYQIKRRLNEEKSRCLDRIYLCFVCILFSQFLNLVLKMTLLKLLLLAFHCIPNFYSNHFFFILFFIVFHKINQWSEFFVYTLLKTKQIKNDRNKNLLIRSDYQIMQTNSILVFCRLNKQKLFFFSFQIKLNLNKSFPIEIINL